MRPKNTYRVRRDFFRGDAQEAGNEEPVKGGHLQSQTAIMSRSQLKSIVN